MKLLLTTWIFAGTLSIGAATAMAADSQPLVRTVKDAIAIAHTYSGIVFVPDSGKDEAYWQEHFTAILADGVWYVRSKPAIPDYGLSEIWIGAQDGRYLTRSFKYSAR